MTTNKNETKHMRREHILACAQRVFAERGVVDVTMEEIARSAGVSKGALYLLFRSKDELYLQLAFGAAKGLVERLRAVDGNANGFAHVGAILRAYTQYYIEEPTRFPLAFAWLTPGFTIDETAANGPYRDTIVEAIRISIDAFAAGQRDGSIRGDRDPRRTILQLWGAIVGLLMLRTRALDPAHLPLQVSGAVWSILGDDAADPARELTRSIEEFIDFVMAAVKV
jgi:AcrR family transcriptional regulator